MYKLSKIIFIFALHKVNQGHHDKYINFLYDYIIASLHVIIIV